MDECLGKVAHRVGVGYAERYTMSVDIRQSLEAFCDEVLLHNKHMDGVHAWIRDAAPRVFGRAFRDAFHQKYGFCISQKELRLVETMGAQTGYAIQTYALEPHSPTKEQISAFAKALIRRQLYGYSYDEYY